MGERRKMLLLASRSDNHNLAGLPSVIYESDRAFFRSDGIAARDLKRACNNEYWGECSSLIFCHQMISHLSHSYIDEADQGERIT